MTLIEKIKKLVWYNSPSKLKEILLEISGNTFIPSEHDLDEFLNESANPYIRQDEIVVGDFIPLTGTTEGNPVTGDIEFYSTAEERTKGFLSFNDTGELGLISRDRSRGVLPHGFISNDVYFSVEDSYGFKSDTDHSANYNDLTYVQKIYVDNPETLINALNNCDSTQLDEIKTILGII